MPRFDYPFESDVLMSKRRSIVRELKADGSKRIKKKIAVNWFWIHNIDEIKC